MRSHFQSLLCVASLCAVAQAQTTPTITSLNPPSAPAGSPAVALVVAGKNFQMGCYVTWNNQVLVSSFASSVEIDATVPASYLTIAGEMPYVGVSCPGPVQSNLVQFLVTGSTNVTITTPATLPQGTAGSSYSISLAASGGHAPYQWSPVTALPAGLTLTTGGLLSGTPTTANQYVFTIQVTDSSSPPLTAQQSFSLTVSGPGGGGGTLTISTTSLPAATVGQTYSTTLMASGGSPPYTWSSSNLPSWLTLVAASGVLSGTPPSAGTVTFMVQVTDSASHTSSSSLSLVVSAASLSSLIINTCAALPQGSPGASYNVSLAASGGTQPYLWSALTALPPGLNLSSGGVLSGTPTTATQYAFTIQVSDSSSPQLTAQQNFSLTITSAGGATLTFSTCSLPAAMASQPYTTTLTAAGGTPPYTWMGTSLPSWLTLTAPNGLLGGTPPAVGTYPLTVQVSDSASHTASMSFSLSVTASSTSLSITTPLTLPAGVVGAAYPSTALSVSGGVGPYTWVIFSGNMPAGLSLDQNAGTITGTPQAAGTFSFTVQVADSTGLDAMATFSLTVTATAVTPLTISTTSLSGAASGQAYTATLTASGGTPPYTWMGTSLPSWLTLMTTSNGTGALSGTPPAGGTFTISVQVTDSTAPTARTVSRSFTLVVTSGSISITTASPLPAGMVGAAYPSTTLAATGGTAPYTWVILSGNTDGLSLDPTGIISGTPQTAGTFNFTVQVTDNAGLTGSKAFALTISGPSLTITTVGASTGTVGVAFSQSYTVVGGTAPYTWKVTSGPLPGWLTLTPTTPTSSPVTLSGTPTQQGSFTITLQATDASNAVGTRTFTITIAAGSLRITSASQLPDATLGGAYTYQMAAAGGTAPYTWSATGLPAGLTISGSGLITGTVGAAGALTFVVKVTDSAQPPVTVNGNVQINVKPAPLPAITISGLPATADPSLPQYTVTIGLASAYPVNITGTAILSSSPADNGPTDGSIQFATGGKSASFSIPAGSTSTTLALQTGTVAGTITLTLSQLSAGGTDVTPTPAPSAKTQMAGAAPVITAATFSTNASTNTLTVQITGYATSREITQAVFTFTAASGQTLQTGASSITISLSSLFASYFPQNASTGSQFVYSQPFTIQGGTNAVNSVIPQNVTLTNRVGSSSMAAIH